MKVKTTLVAACLAIALLMTFGSTTNAQAQCCVGEILGAPIYAAGAILSGAVAVVGGAATWVAGVASAPFNGCCTACAPACAAPPVSFCG